MINTVCNDANPRGNGEKYKQCCFKNTQANQAVGNKTGQSGLLEIALGHHQTGNLLEAETICLHALSLDQNDCNVLHLLGLLAMQNNKLEQAIKFLSRAISINPLLYAVHFSLGNAYQAQGKLGQAICSYQQALSLKPDYAEAHNNIGVACKALGRLVNALNHYNKAISLSPDFVEARNNLGNLYKDMDKPQLATACFNPAILLKPEYAEKQ